MEAPDYESLPTSKMGVHMTAGAIAGIMEHCCMFPVDSVKTRMQSLAPSPEARYSSVGEGLMKMVNREGALRTLRGISAVIVGAGPAHALYFTAYEEIRKKFGSKHSFHNTMVNAAAGCGATVMHDAIMVPSEVLKQRMQMFNSPYKSCIDCMCKVYCNEGIKAFYRSYSTQMLMNLPFHATHIVIYEKISDVFNPDRQYNPKVHMAAGGVAGAVAAAITTPLDVCKTLLNTQEPATLNKINTRHVSGMKDAVKTIYALQGKLGFFRGLNARILYQMPGTAISWSVYELFKHQLTKNTDDFDEIPSNVSLDNESHASPVTNFPDNKYPINQSSSKTVDRLLI